jgi:hypothetical protein
VAARLAVSLGLLLSTGCLHADTEVLRRAAVEFRPCQRLELTARPELSEATYDVDACGYVARYTCTKPSGYPLTCAREPDPKQAAPPSP